MSLTEVILSYLSESHKTNKNLIELYNTLTIPNLSKLKDLFYSFFASIPHDWYRKNTYLPKTRKSTLSAWNSPEMKRILRIMNGKN